jgi:hypothetical protein
MVIHTVLPLFQNHAERASVKNWDDLTPALMAFATAPAALGISLLRTQSARTSRTIPEVGKRGKSQLSQHYVDRNDQKLRDRSSK